MATHRYSITGTAWTAISSSGTSGTVIMVAGGACMVDHSQTDSSTCALSKSYPLNTYVNPTDILHISADGTADIFYARCPDPAGTAVLISDMI